MILSTTFGVVAPLVACHNVPFMWRAFHQMHHGPQRLDVPGALVFHPLELVVQNVVSIGVLVFVLGLDPLAAAFTGYALAFGTFKNPESFEGRVGFARKASFAKMLVGIDVSRSPGDHVAEAPGEGAVAAE
jgi:hypothetical protein